MWYKEYNQDMEIYLEYTYKTKMFLLVLYEKLLMACIPAFYVHLRAVGGDNAMRISI